jgi:hypothetical protein
MKRVWPIIGVRDVPSSPQAGFCARRTSYIQSNAPRVIDRNCRAVDGVEEDARRRH